MKCTYLINMDDGRLEFNDEYTVMQANLKPIPDDVTAMILSGEVLPQDVISAISVKIRESGDFNIAEYLEGIKKLNVRRSNRQEASVRAMPADVAESVSAEDVKAAKSSGASDVKVERKTRPRKAEETPQSQDSQTSADIFSKL